MSLSVSVILRVGVVTAALSLSTPAFPQDAGFDAAGGYILLRDRELDANLHGWHVSVAGQLNPWLHDPG